MLNTNPAVGPREELALAVVQGEGATDGLVTDKILPDMPITRRTAHLIVLKAADTQARRIIADPKFLRAPGAKYERLSMKFGDDKLTVNLRGVEIPVPYEAQMDYADYLNLENVVCGRLGEMSPLTKECLRIQALTSTATFGVAVNSSVPYTQANKQTINPFGDIINLQRVRRAVGEPFDTALVPGPVFDYWRQSPGVLAFLRNNIAAGLIEVTEDALAKAFALVAGIKQFLIADSYYNNGADGTLAYQQMMPNTYVGLYRAGKVGGSAAPENTTEAGAPTAPGIAGVTIPTLAGVGCTTFWQGWDDRGIPLPVGSQQNGHQMPGGNFVGIYWVEDGEYYVARLKMSQTPYIGNANAGVLLATQAVNAAGPLQ